MRKVLWSGSLKHQGASLTTTPPPPSSSSSPRAERPNQGRAACVQPRLPAYRREAAQMVVSAAEASMQQGLEGKGGGP